MKKDKRIKGMVYRQCGKKTRYKDESAVRAVKKKCEAARGEKLDWYYCSYCKGYHLTSLLEPPKSWEE